MSDIGRAIELASEAHAGQMRLDTTSYILHPLRVMHTVAIQGHSEATQIVAVLHDAIEDSSGNITLSVLRDEGYGDEVLVPLELLTKEDGIEYSRYIERLAGNERARAVKRADLFDNMNITGIENPSKHLMLNIEKYGNALIYLARFSQPRV